MSKSMKRSSSVRRRAKELALPFVMTMSFGAPPALADVPPRSEKPFVPIANPPPRQMDPPPPTIKEQPKGTVNPPPPPPAQVDVRHVNPPHRDPNKTTTPPRHSNPPRHVAPATTPPDKAGTTIKPPAKAG